MRRYVKLFILNIVAIIIMFLIVLVRGDRGGESTVFVMASLPVIGAVSLIYLIASAIYFRKPIFQDTINLLWALFILLINVLELSLLSTFAIFNGN